MLEVWSSQAKLLNSLLIETNVKKNKKDKQTNKPGKHAEIFI